MYVVEYKVKDNKYEKEKVPNKAFWQKKRKDMRRHFLCYFIV